MKTPEELEKINNDMMTAFGGAEGLENLGGLVPQEDEDEQD